MGLNLKGRMQVRRLVLRSDLMITFKRIGQDGALERITAIDRLERDGKPYDGEYKVAVDTPLGVYVEREGFLPKLLLWHNIQDVDFEGTPPDYGDANMLPPAIPQAQSGALNAAVNVASAPKANLAAK